MIKRLGIFGAGNVGASLVMAVAADEIAESVTVGARKTEAAEAIILDLASAFPGAATRFSATESLAGEFDVVVVTAGATPHADISMNELLGNNAKIVTEALRDVVCSTVVVIGTPVDRLTELLTNDNSVEGRRFIGFGGQLDVARTRFALLRRGIEADPVYVVGEHGPRMVPSYVGEKNFDDVAQEASTVLKRITQSGRARNLATGIQLAKLLQALDGTEQELCISLPDGNFEGLSITWPYRVSGKSVRKVDINLGAQATARLRNLIATRKIE